MKKITTYKDIEIWEATPQEVADGEAQDQFFCNYGLGWQGFPRYIGNYSLEALKEDIDYILREGI